MAFGDNSTVFQRSGRIPGGLKIEAGEWTQGSTTDISIPTRFTQIFAFVSNTGDGSAQLTSQAEISNSFIKGTTNETTSGVSVAYIAIGV
jgi:phosphoserine aminotransferase